jgi:hypothetical protein
MAAKGQSFAERFSRWELLLAHLKEAEGFAHVAEDQRRLEELLAQARALEVEKEGFVGETRKRNSRLRVLAQEGDTVRGRIGANLQGKYGFRSEELIRFGFKPRQVPRRAPASAKKKKEPTSQPAPAA